MSSVRALPPEALEELRTACKNRKTPGFARRARGVLMFAEGRHYLYICEALSISKEAVRLWLRSYEAKGIAGLVDQPRPARTRVKSKQIEEAVEEIIHRPPLDFGFDRSTWSLESITEYVLASRGVQVGLQTVREVLSEKGYRWRRAKHSVTSPDPEYQAKKGAVDALRDSPPEGWSVLFEDETDIHWLPLLASSWTKKGVQVHVPTPRNNQKRYCFGAVDYHTGESYFRLSRKKDSKAFVAFLKQLMSRTSKKIILICDNYSVHKTQAVRDFVKEHADRLQLVFLPTYSPWLNPIELFWRHLKKRVLANRFFETVAAQMRELWKRLSYLASDGPQVRRLIGADAS